MTYQGQITYQNEIKTYPGWSCIRAAIHGHQIFATDIFMLVMNLFLLYIYLQNNANVNSYSSNFEFKMTESIKWAINSHTR